MKQINTALRNPSKQQVSGPTISQDQIKPMLGVKLTKAQIYLFEYVAQGVPVVSNIRTITTLTAKNLIRREQGKLVLTAKGLAYAKLKGLVK